MATVGKVYLVGAGPGDPGLITLRGQQCLAQADAVLYDYLVNPRLLALAGDAEQICLGRHGRTKIWSQAEINDELTRRALAGQRVVRLKSGDPTVFARGAEEVEALAEQDIPVEIIPGVTSALAAASCAGIPLTHRDVASAVALVTGHERADKQDPLDFRRLSGFPGTLAIYMGVTTAAQWTAELIAGGMAPDAPAALIRRVSYPDQRTWCGRLDEIPAYISEQGLRPPVIALIGPAARQRAALGWFERRPLFGQRVLVTRPGQSAEQLAAPLSEFGAEVWVQPAIDVAPMDDWTEVDQSISEVRGEQWDWVVFSSANGVRFWLERFLQSADFRQLRCKLAAVGKGTANALKGFKLNPDLIPAEFHAEGLVQALADRWQDSAPAAGESRVLLIRASRGRDVLRTELDRMGAHVGQVAAYQNVDVTEPDPAVVEQFDEAGFDWVTVTSSAIARSLATMWGSRLKETRLASISPITSTTLRELGLEPHVEAETHTMQGVVDAMVNAAEGEG